MAEGDEETTTLSTLQVAAATTKSAEQTQLTMLLDMVKSLQATVTEYKETRLTDELPNRGTALSASRSLPAGNMVRRGT